MSRLLSSKPARTVLSVWSWFVLGVTLFVVVPVMGVIRVATWRDEGRYKAGLLFRKVAAVHPRFQTPYVSIMICAALGVGFVLLRSFEQLADTFVTAIIPFYALGVASIYVLRRRAGYNPPFWTPGYPVVPALFVLATIYLLLNAIIDPTSRWPTLAVFGVILVGIPVYYATVGRSGSVRPVESAAD